MDSSDSLDDPVILALNIILEDALEISKPWEKLMFPNLRVSLDEQAEMIASEVEARQAARKSLAQFSKGFKAEVSSGGVTLEATDEIIKAFKAEVDATTKRAKAAEGYFLVLYRSLRDESLRDPGPVLRRCHELGIAGISSLRQRMEVNKRAESQAEVLFARLAEMGLSSAGSSEMLEDGGSALVALEKLLAEERRSIGTEAEREAAQQWETERLSLKQACDETVARATAASDRRVELLEAQLAISAGEAEAGAAAVASRGEVEAAFLKVKTDRESLETKLSAAQRALEDCLREAEISAADSVRAMHDASSRADKAELRAAELSTVGATAEAAVIRLEAEAAELRARAPPTEVDALKRQVKLLETLQFGDSEEDMSDGGDDADGSGAPSQRSKTEIGTTLEGTRAAEGGADRDASIGDWKDTDDALDWFVKHTGRLKKRLERERTLRQQAERAVRDAEAKISSSNEEAAAARELASKLQGDLVTAQSVVESGKVMLRAFQSRPENNAMGGAPAKSQSSRGFFSFGGYGAGSHSTGGHHNENAKNCGDAGLSLGRDIELETDEAGAMSKFGAENRLLEAVQGQRDRFRREAQRREGELSLAKRISDQVTAEAKQLRFDNTQLYKKIRYFSNGGGGGGGDWSSLEATETKYASLYDASVDPFKQWESEERLNASARLYLPDRALLTAMEWFLPSVLRRAALMLHLLLVHSLLVWCRFRCNGCMGDAAVEVATEAHSMAHS